MRDTSIYCDICKEQIFTRVYTLRLEPMEEAKYWKGEYDLCEECSIELREKLKPKGSKK